MLSVNDDSFTAKFVTYILMAAIAVGLFMDAHNKSVHGQSLTITGPMPGVMSVFNSSGAPMNSYYCTILTGNSTTSGTFSLTGTGPIYNGSTLWTNPSGAWVDDINIYSAGAAVAQSYTPYQTALGVSSNTITLSGTVKSPTTLVVLGATAINSSVAQPMVARVCSN